MRRQDAIPLLHHSHLQFHPVAWPDCGNGRQSYLIARTAGYELPVHSQGVRPTGFEEAIHRWAAAQWPLSVRIPFDVNEEIRLDVLQGLGALEWWTDWPEGWTLDATTDPAVPRLTSRRLHEIMSLLKGVAIPPQDHPVLDAPPTETAS